MPDLSSTTALALLAAFVTVVAFQAVLARQNRRREQARLDAETRRLADRRQAFLAAQRHQRRTTSRSIPVGAGDAALGELERLRPNRLDHAA